MATARDICTNALRELNVIDAIDPMPGEMAVFALGKLNRLLDVWNADRQTVYADVLTTFAFSPNVSPHTIGASGGTWTLNPRPVDIPAITIIDGTTYLPITPITKDEYLALAAPTTASTYPRVYWYNPAWSLGQIYFYPVPDTAKSARVNSRVILASLTLDSSFSLPQGYEEAITLTLAERLAPTYGAMLPPDLITHARDARTRVFGNNRETPRLCTADVGMPGGGGGVYDYRVGPYRT